MDLTFDRQHIWHPYTSTIDPLPCIGVSHAQGVHLYTDTGQALIDGMSSWWSAIHGYGHPQLNQAATDQLDNMSHVMFGGITHQPAITLCKQLLALTPSNLQQVFLADSGSVSVEVALKIALQYWHSLGQSRPKFVSLRHGYHGDTFAAMSVTDPDNSMHGLYKGFLPQHLFVDSPRCGFDDEWDPSDSDPLAKLLEDNHDQVAAVVLEPIVQGAGGMRFYHLNYLKSVRALCDKYGLLLICDEIATGFGRTGKLFAVEHAEIEPDILCVGKALTGGYMTLAATLTTKTVADTVCSGEAGCFMHGPTFMGNPLACAVASASLKLIESGEWRKQVAIIEETLKLHLPLLASSPTVKSVRVLGAIGVVETYRNVDMTAIQAYFVSQGVWIRPFGRLIYIMPPYIIEPNELLILIHAIAGAVEQPSLFQQA